LIIDADERDRHRVGAYTVARAAGGVAARQGEIAKLEQIKADLEELFSGPCAY
jgi:hypothetical protein